MMDVRTILRWQDADPAALAGHTVVVIDVLRWTTVVVTAFANGARRLEACATPDEARERARVLGRHEVVLGGERDNRALPGFDVGNSPLEYTRARVAGRVLVSTTTNGTQALLRAQGAARVLIGAFTNLGAIVDTIVDALVPDRPEGASDSRVVTLLCAGRSGEEALEDTMCAGAIATALRGVADAETRRAVELWLAHGADAARAVSAAPHAAVLRSDGFGPDVDVACSHSTLSIVPQARGAVVELAPT